MKSSQSVTKIVPALLKAKKEMADPKKAATNPYFKSKYVDLNSALESAQILEQYGIFLLQPHYTNELGTFVETVLMHESGEWLSSDTKVEVAKQNDPQALGSAYSYARRYGLTSFLGMGSDDDDGEKNYSRGTKTETKPTTVSKPVEVKPATAQLTPAAVGATLVTGNTGDAAKEVTPAKKPSFKDRAAKKPAPVSNGVADSGGLG